MQIYPFTQYWHASEGDNLGPVNCASNKGLTVSWTTPSGNYPHDSLLLQNITEEDFGAYQCEAEDWNNTCVSYVFYVMNCKFSTIFITIKLSYIREIINYLKRKRERSESAI